MNINDRDAELIAVKLNDSLIQRYWIEREVGSLGVQKVLRRACELAGREYRHLVLSSCFPIDLEEFLRKLPDVPGVIVLDEYDQTDDFLVNLVNFMLLYYDYRSMVSSDKTEVSVPLSWKFVIITKPRAWIPDPQLHRVLCKI
jgi:hypothetical protein